MMNDNGQSKKKPSGDYEVGYRKPPKASQFRKGQSGNPRGHRKNVKSLRTLLTAALDEKVTVHENGEHRRISKRELAAIQLANGLAKGDLRSFRAVVLLIGEKEEREEQESAAAGKSSARERVTAKLNALRARIEAGKGLPPEDEN
jgi:hypothetical protein